jgi:hypothetical protein
MRDGVPRRSRRVANVRALCGLAHDKLVPAPARPGTPAERQIKQTDSRAVFHIIAVGVAENVQCCLAVKSVKFWDWIDADDFCLCSPPLQGSHVRNVGPCYELTTPCCSLLTAAQALEQTKHQKITSIPQTKYLLTLLKDKIHG